MYVTMVYTKTLWNLAEISLDSRQFMETSVWKKLLERNRFFDSKTYHRFAKLVNNVLGISVQYQTQPFCKRAYEIKNFDLMKLLKICVSTWFDLNRSSFRYGIIAPKRKYCQLINTNFISKLRNSKRNKKTANNPLSQSVLH